MRTESCEQFENSYHYFVSGIATLLSIISKSDRDFPSLVLQKLEFVFLNYLEEDDVMASKLCLRALASLASSKSLAVDGDAGFCSVLWVKYTKQYKICHKHGLS